MNEKYLYICTLFLKSNPKHIRVFGWNHGNLADLQGVST